MGVIGGPVGQTCIVTGLGGSQRNALEWTMQGLHYSQVSRNALEWSMQDFASLLARLQS